MLHRVTTWVILIWTALMGLGIFGAFLGIGGDCAGLTGSEFLACQGDAWIRGSIGISLLLLLWFIVLLPFAIMWLVSRPKESRPVVWPASQPRAVSGDEAKNAVEQQGWTDQPSSPTEAAPR